MSFFKLNKKNEMKKPITLYLLMLVLTISGLSIPTNSKAYDVSMKEQNNSKDNMLTKSKKAKAAFIKNDADMNKFFKNAHAYVIFPNVGKGALVVGGASGNGMVFEHGHLIGKGKMLQVTVGVQAGGKAYSEVIFFENKAALERFKDDKLEFSGQASAVAAKSGASATAKYADGVLVFTRDLGGLMVEASIGGQKFTYKKL